MKLSIRFKVIALGALLSVVATATSLLLTNFSYRSNGYQAKLESVNKWIEYGNESVHTNNIYGALSETIDYVKEIYETNPPEQRDFKDFFEKRNYYSNRFLWLYPFDGISMRYITPQERDFRAIYMEDVQLLSDMKNGSQSVSAYLAYYDATQHYLYYLCDDLAFTRNNKVEYHLPGDRVRFDGVFEEDGAFYKTNFNNEVARCFPIYSELDKGHTIVAYCFLVYNFDEVNKLADNMMLLETITLSIVALGLIIAYAVMSHLFFTRNLKKLSEATTAFGTSLRNKDVLEIQNPNIKSKDEISDLSNALISLEESVIYYSDALEKETKEKEKINAELGVASKIQLEALPPSRFNDENVGIKAFIKTAKEVGGDFYDYFYKDHDHFAFVIADVSGKGVPASLFMMRAKELIRFKISTIDSLTQAAYEINNILINNNQEGLFVTAFIGVINLKKKTMKYIDAGHEKPYLITKEGVSQFEINTNFVFGGVKDFIYQEGEIPFNIDDRLFLYTDGLNESINASKEEFGYERIQESLQRNHELSNEDIVTNIDNDLNEFCKEEEAFDDITIVMVEMKDMKNNLSLIYHRPGFEVIEQVTDEFNKKFSFLKEEIRSEVAIIIDEILNNYISYEKRKNLEICVNFSLNGDYLEMIFSNNGAEFDPLQKEDKYLEEYDKNITPGGFGITLVKNFSSSIKYERNNHLNTLVIKKKI